VENGELLPRDFNLYARKFKDNINFKYTLHGETLKSDWQCTYCEYRTKCWKLDEFKASEHEYLKDFLEEEQC
jgi:MoaA/NifB/PqqE/SkfB family radical SAM enzyme